MAEVGVSPPGIRVPSIREIIQVFLHLGVTAYGGLAMVEPIRRRVVQDKGWLDQAEFLDGLALCQMVPGATVVQLATYVGYRLGRPRGRSGSGSFIFPAFVLMLGLSGLYFTYGHIAWVKSVSRGLGVVVIALLLQTVWHLGRNVGKHWIDVAIALLALLALRFQANYLLVFGAAGLLRLSLSRGGLAGPVAPRGTMPGPGLPASRVLTELALTLLGLAVLVGPYGAWIPNGSDGRHLYQDRRGRLRRRLCHDPHPAMGPGGPPGLAHSSSSWTASSWVLSPPDRLSLPPPSWVTG